MTTKPASLVPRKGDKIVKIYLDDPRNNKDFLEKHKNFVVIPRKRPKKHKKSGHHSVHKHHPKIKTKKHHPHIHGHPKHRKPGDPIVDNPFDPDEDDLEELNSDISMEDDSENDEDEANSQFLFHEEHSELNSPEAHLMNTNPQVPMAVYKGSTQPFVPPAAAITDISVDPASIVAQKDAADGTISFKASLLFDEEDDVDKYDVIVTQIIPVAASVASSTGALIERAKTWNLNDATVDLGSGSYQLTTAYWSRGNIVTNEVFLINGLVIEFNADLTGTTADGFNVAVVNNTNEIGSGGLPGYAGDGGNVALMNDVGFHMTGVAARTWSNNDVVYYNHSNVDESVNTDQRLTGLDLRGSYNYRVTFFKPSASVISARFEKLTGDPFDITYDFTGPFTDTSRRVEIGCATGVGGITQVISNIHIYSYG